MQRSFWHNWLVEVAYAGSHGRRLSKRYNAYSNVTPGVLYDVTPGVATRYPQLNQMLYSSQSGWSDFNGLNLKLERRFANGFQILMAHTWSKSIDNDSAGSFGSPNLNPANFQLDKGPSDFDIRHRWVTSLLYELPFGRDKHFLSGIGRAADLVVGGWQVNAIHLLADRRPAQRQLAEPDRHFLCDAARRRNRDRPRIRSFNGITPGEDFGGTNTSRYWFNPAAFAATKPLKFGTSGRDIITAPSWWNTDLSLFKNFCITREHETAVPRGGVQCAQQREVLPAGHERGESDVRDVAKRGPSARDAARATLHFLMRLEACSSPLGGAGFHLPA